jgi:hypothetical protein
MRYVKVQNPERTGASAILGGNTGPSNRVMLVIFDYLETDVARIALTMEAARALGAGLVQLTEEEKDGVE